MKDSLGDRIKAYETVTRHYALKRVPLIVRVDGRAFSTYTRHFAKPFDAGLIESMVVSAEEVAKDMQGCVAVYVQSDEATFCLIDYQTIESQGWFDYNLSKIISLSASKMSVTFNYITDIANREKLPIFDSRAFNVPATDVANMFLWRCKDWERNSLSMYCRSFFSHKQMNNKSKEQQHEMLYSIGKNWATDLPDKFKNGTFILKTERGYVRREDIKATYKDVSEVINPLIYLND